VTTLGFELDAQELRTLYSLIHRLHVVTNDANARLLTIGDTLLKIFWGIEGNFIVIGKGEPHYTCIRA
jgi:hypothetical protein